MEKILFGILFGFLGLLCIIALGMLAFMLGTMFIIPPKRPPR